MTLHKCHREDECTFVCSYVAHFVFGISDTFVKGVLLHRHVTSLTVTGVGGTRRQGERFVARLELYTLTN